MLHIQLCNISSAVRDMHIVKTVSSISVPHSIRRGFVWDTLLIFVCDFIEYVQKCKYPHGNATYSKFTLRDLTE
jgi:hypothetical protein